MTDDIFVKAIKEEVKRSLKSIVINSSNIYFETEGCHYIVSSNMSAALKDLDKTLKFLKEKIKSGEKGKIVFFDKDGNLVDSGLDLNSICLKNHAHDEYISRVITADTNNIMVFNSSGRASDSGINISEIEKIKEILKKINKVDAKENSILLSDVDGNIISSDKKIEDFSLSNHTHNNKVNKANIEENNIVIAGNNNSIKDSNVSIDDIVRKKDLEKKIKGTKGDILIVDSNGNIKNSKKNIENFSLTGHTHTTKDINNLINLCVQSVLNSEKINNIIEKKVNDILRKKFSN